MSAAGKSRGALAIVLHTHMPYVEGFGTWPFGEEWLWEAIAGCYLPLLDFLDARDPSLTLSITPVLCDQLSAPDLAERFHRFIDDTRRFTHAEDAAGLRAGGHAGLAAELERAWSSDYEHAAQRMAARGGDLLRAFAPHVRWTSSATHAVLPLLATDAGARLQIEAGIASHLDRFGGRSSCGGRDSGRRDGEFEDGRLGRAFGGWQGGFWLPECAHAPHLEPILAAAGIRSTCVELTRHHWLGAREHLRPLLSDSGIALFGIDRATISLVWSDAGYPADGLYRDYHRHTVHHHNPWRNDGDAYDHEPALARAREHAADFVLRTRERLRRDGDGLPGGGLAVCALDTELLGHWWYEGLHWLEAVIEECASQGLELVRLDDALERFEPAPVGDAEWSASEWSASSWGAGGNLSTWSGPAVADMAFAARAAELQTLAAATEGRAGPAVVRELLALQASDWAFMISRGLAVPYARERYDGHRAAVAAALREGPQASVEGLRELAVGADLALLLAP
ncbi:MAG TPA: 1,4-alpha-glucan branching protein domain-containing protein [Solirubrobacteraceae bacterium]|nr:1,4-alpha-glucan branching protein domain-containing protein [Solirubrobacteraceae bacterium]